MVLIDRRSKDAGKEHKIADIVKALFAAIIILLTVASMSSFVFSKIIETMVTNAILCQRKIKG